MLPQEFNGLAILIHAGVFLNLFLHLRIVGFDP